MKRIGGVGSSKRDWAERNFSYAVNGKLAFGDQENLVNSGVGGENVAAKHAAGFEGGGFFLGLGKMPYCLKI